MNRVRTPEVLHREMLRRLLADERLVEKERDAFSSMAEYLGVNPRAELTARQLGWARAVFDRLELDADDAANLWSAGAVPAGAPVPTPDVLRRLPMRPPGRRA